MAYVTVCMFDIVGGDPMFIGVTPDENGGYCFGPVGCHAFDTKAEADTAGQWFMETQSDGSNPNPRFKILTTEEFLWFRGVRFSR